MDAAALNNLASKVETPAFVFRREEFDRRAALTRDILDDRIGLCYSIKANPFLVGHLPDTFDRVEVCSPGELEICIARNVPPEMIIYSGLNKGAEDIARALDYGVTCITAESRLHLDTLAGIMADREGSVDVLIRISARSQFGIDRREAATIIAGRDEFSGLRFAGLHYFTGTQKRKSKEILRELDFLNRYMDELEADSGFVPERIEYGTGLPAHLFMEKDITTLDQAHDGELTLLKEIAGPLAELSDRAEVTIEMGRFFAASCGHYLSGVVDTKTNDGVNYAVIDGGSHQIRYFGQMQGMQIPFMDRIGEDAEPAAEDAVDPAAGEVDPAAWTICGSLCTTADVLARNAHLPGLCAGDVLVFHQAGAYAVYEGMSHFLSRDLPRIYLEEVDGTLTMLRDRIETNPLNTFAVTC